MKITRRQYRIKKRIISVFMILCIIGIIYSLYNIYIWKKNVDKNNEIKEITKKHVKEEKKSEKDEVKEYKIDFDALKKSNSDTVGYIKVNNTNIDYVVVQTKDNSYYLNHNFNKEKNRAGWIFLDYRNKLDGSDKNTIIYGHNMKDGSMFETLSNVLQKWWYEDSNNYIVTFTTEEKTFMYQVFSTYDIKNEDYYIKTKFNSDNDYEKFLKTIKSRSNHDYGIELTKDDTILTLSSCLGAGEKRVVLHAKKVN
ncbi:MAG: class B sortase [Bacilli bacterium]|nr:class B sortase [Bacilli bacterium]